MRPSFRDPNGEPHFSLAKTRLGSRRLLKAKTHTASMKKPLISQVDSLPKYICSEQSFEEVGMRLASIRILCTSVPVRPSGTESEKSSTLSTRYSMPLISNGQRLSWEDPLLWGQQGENGLSKSREIATENSKYHGQR